MIIIIMRGENFVAHLDRLGGTPVCRGTPVAHHCTKLRSQYFDSRQHILWIQVWMMEVSGIWRRQNSKRLSIAVGTVLFHKWTIRYCATGQVT
jgi:hypothetical protein